MLALPDLQRRMRTALLGGDVGSAAALVQPDRLLPEARLAIYRHHVVTTLTEVLAGTFPVVARLVDRRFFGYGVDRYIREHPPASPCLHEYGADFAAFLAAFAPCQPLAYLDDVARMEWALHRAYHADDGAPIDPARLTTVPSHRWAELGLRLHPATALVASPWPVDDIWRANQPGADPDAVVDLEAGPVALAIGRMDGDPFFRRLTPADYHFRDVLAKGGALGDAAEGAFSVASDFDLTGALHALLAEGAIVDVLDRSDKEIQG